MTGPAYCGYCRGVGVGGGTIAMVGYVVVLVGVLYKI